MGWVKAKYLYNKYIKKVNASKLFILKVFLRKLYENYPF